MRTTLQFASLAVVATLATACERPTAPIDSPRLSAGRAPNASISDAAHSGRLGFYFLPSLVPDPGPFTGTFDAELQPRVTICPVAACDFAAIAAFLFGGSGPTAITVDPITESYGANWNKPTLDVGKYRLQVRLTVPLLGAGTEKSLGFADLQVVSNKKDPVDAGFVKVVKGSPIPFKFRIETGIVAGMVIQLPHLRNLHVGDAPRDIFARPYDLHGELVDSSCLTWTSSNPSAVSVTPFGLFGGRVTALAIGSATITVSCRDFSTSFPAEVVPPEE